MANIIDVPGQFIPREYGVKLAKLSDIDNNVYGPYESIAAAHTALSAIKMNVVGMTVGIIGANNTIVEYWYQGGTSESNLVKKQSDVTIDAYTKQESDAKYQPKGNYATEQQLEDKANKSEMTIIEGAPGSSAEGKATITLKQGISTTVLTQHQDISGKANTSDVNTALAGKQDTINDIATIRSGAAAGATAQQPATTLAGYGITDAYTKTEVNGLVDTPHQEYVTVDAYASLPAQGSADTIYRVSNYNGSTSQVDASVYSEYAWNGTQYIFLCVKSQIGEVFDISVYNNNAKYANLAAALNGGANIPQSLQKGGMSIKFVQSSDNKYVQYRLVSNSFNTTPSNWQKSGAEVSVSQNTQIGGFDLIIGDDTKAKGIGANMGGTIEIIPKDSGEYYNIYDVKITNPSFSCTDELIKVSEGDKIFYTGFSGNDTVGAILGYSATKTFVSALLAGDGKYYNKEISIPSRIAFIRISVGNSNHGNYIVPHIVLVKNQRFIDDIDALQTDIDALQTEIDVNINSLSPQGTGLSKYQASSNVCWCYGYSTSCVVKISGITNGIDNIILSKQLNLDGDLLSVGCIKSGNDYYIDITPSIYSDGFAYIRIQANAADAAGMVFTEYGTRPINKDVASLKEDVADLKENTDVTITSPVNIDAHASDNTIWWNNMNSLITAAGIYDIKGGIVASVKLATDLSSASVTREVTVTEVGEKEYTFEVLATDIQAGVHYVRIQLSPGAVITLVKIVESNPINAFVKENRERIIALENTQGINLNGKKISVIGDSISTIYGNNNPYWKVKSIDVGQQIQSYVTWWDVWANDAGTNPTNKTIGGSALTAEMIGTLQTFTPILDDVGKSIGTPLNYNSSDTKVWSENLCELTGATLLANASWSGSRICSGQTGTWVISEAWNDYTIGCCKVRDDEGNDIIPDIIIIYRGTNDFSHGPISQINDVSLASGIPDTDYINSHYEYKAGYYKTIQKLRTAYPKAYIICCTLNVFKRMIYDKFPTRNSDYTLPQMNNAIREVANTMGCGLIEFDKDGITFENCYSGGYITDDATYPTHPNSKGHAVMADRAISDIRYILNK